MTAPSEQPHHPPKSPLARMMVPSRIILFALLIVAAIGLVIDQGARKKAGAAYESINEAMGPERRLKDVKREDVHKLMGREPDADSDAEDLYETYTWQGAIFPQRVYVQYRPGLETVLKDVSLNNPPEGFPD